MKTDQVIGTNIKKVREKLGYTQAEISDIFGIKRSTYSNYESGEREMPFDLLEKVADLFGCDSYLLFDESSKAQNEMLATAFRLNNLIDSDYDEIIKFKDIVKTSLKLDRIEAND